MLASLAGFTAVGWLPGRMLVPLPDVLATTLGRQGVHLNPSLDLCRLVGALAVVVRLRRQADRTDMFLMAWLVLEVVGSLLLNPFVAVRRVMGLAVVAALAIGRLASRTCASPERQRLTRAVVAYGAVPLSSRPPGPRLRVTVYRVLGDVVPDAERLR
jgi:hypothetical protein